MAVQPGTYNITLQRRADYSLLLQFKDSSDAVINLTGYTAYAQAWDKARATKYADFSVAYTNRTNGQITISLTDTQTATFIDELYYDVLLEDGSGSREYYLEGVIFVSQGYTAP
nr:putative long tail fiber protein [uncultured Mediterranean phage uvMED]